MIEVLFAAWLATVGVLLLTPAAESIPPWGAGFVAPIAATALFVLAGLGLASASLFSVALAIALVTAAALVVSIPSAWRGDVTLRWLARALGGAVSVAVVVAVVTQWIPMVRLTTDSYHYLMSSVALVRSGTLTDVSDAFLLKRQLATPLLHTLGVETGRGYVSFWTPLLGVSAFGSMTWLALGGLRAIQVSRRWQLAIIGSALAFTLTANRVIYHLFYINGHMLFAALLLGGVGLAWLAIRTESWTLLLPAALMFGALIPLRAESALVAGVFLVGIMSSLVIPPRWVWALLTPTIAATLLWDAWILPQLLSSTAMEQMRAPLSEILIVAGLIGLAGMRSVKAAREFVRISPWIAAGGIATLLAVLVWREPQIMLDTLVGMSSAMIVTGFWGTFWIVTPPLFFAAIVIGFPGARHIIPGLATFALIIPVLAYLRGAAFGGHPGDSANRMIMHVVPLLMLVIILAAGRAASMMTSGEGEVSLLSGRKRESTVDAVDVKGADSRSRHSRGL